MLEDVQENYGLLMQSLKTGSVVLKKREAWTRIDESVNESAREGGQCRPETLEGHATRPKAATRTGGGPPEPPVPYEDFILTILGENSNHINGTEQREYRFDLLDQFLSSLV